MPGAGDDLRSWRRDPARSHDCVTHPARSGATHTDFVRAQIWITDNANDAARAHRRGRIGWN